jgi:hypothetical protein
MVIYLIGADEYGGDDVHLIDNDAAQGAGGALQAGVVKVEDDQRRFGDLEYNCGRWSLTRSGVAGLVLITPVFMLTGDG